jgi:putative oxygen-independent coproporphyrinogen III oxidase
VSLGAQSFDDRCLAALGRIHGRGEIVAAAVELRAAGIENFNLDLMYGLPGQDLAGAIDDVVRALDLGPTHLSHYQLTLEPGTVFARRPPALPDEDLVLDMQHACAEQIAAAGFEQYEVSAHARPGRRCRHNLNYWSFGDYLGIGAGAHGKVTDPGCERVIRTERVRSPVQFLSASAPGRRVASRRAVDPGELPFEFLLNALRLLDGFDESLFEGRTGQPWAAVAGTAREQEALGLLERTGVGRWAATDRGRLFLNDLQAAFLPGPMHGCASHLGPG